MFCDKRSYETRPGTEVAVFDGSDKCGGHWTENRSVEET